MSDLAAEVPEPRGGPGLPILVETFVDVVSNVHDSVKIGATVFPPNGYTANFNQRTAGLWLAKNVPRTVAEFLVSITTHEREYVIVQPGALPYPP